MKASNEKVRKAAYRKVSKICAYCGKEFEGGQKAKYCSPSHNVMAHRANHGKPVSPWAELAELRKAVATPTSTPTPIAEQPQAVSVVEIEEIPNFRKKVWKQKLADLMDAFGFDEQQKSWLTMTIKRQGQVWKYHESGKSGPEILKALQYARHNNIVNVNNVK